jgi:flagellum-specific ATP synthase
VPVDISSAGCKRHLPVRSDGHLNPVDLGVRCLNTFTTCCEGQRMGIFSGSGVGKSVLMSMLTRNTDVDIAIVGLIGERGREVQEFISEYLGEAGIKRAIVIVATSDESALMRRQAAYLTLTLAEFFRDKGQRVLCMMDSLTRFAMAQREIGLAIGEPPTAKGYPPTVFAELPRLLERAGPGLVNSGSVTGLFTVLVEGDDHNEPIADAVRGILDGHIVMERAIAERGRFPAVNVLRSVSRTMPGCVPEDFRPTLNKARELMSVFADMEELIRLGAYRKGSDPKVDRAIALNPALEAFLSQSGDERTSIADGYNLLATILETGGKGDTA